MKTDQTASTQTAYGSPEWYKARWRARWATLRGEIGDAPSQFHRRQPYDYIDSTMDPGLILQGDDVADPDVDQAWEPPWPTDEEMRAAFLAVTQRLSLSPVERLDEVGRPILSTTWSDDLLEEYYEIDQSFAPIPGYDWLLRWSPPLLSLKSKIYEEQRNGEARAVIADLLFFGNVLIGILLEGAFGTRESAKAYLVQIKRELFDPMGTALEESEQDTKWRDPLIDAVSNLIEEIDFQFVDLPVNYVLRTFMEQVSVDLDLLQRAMHQRNKETYDNYYLPMLNVHSLQFADEFARRAIEPAMDGGLLDRKEILTYLSQRVGVRLLPYHDTILMGVPFAASASFSTDTNDTAPHAAADDIVPLPPSERAAQKLLRVSSDYLAVPHEVGHLLYQHGRQPETGEPIHDVLEAMLFSGDWRLAWMEELFADSYGCIVAGPISVLGFQELLAGGRPATDGALGDHPFPSLRPLIQTQITRTIAARKIAQALVTWCVHKFPEMAEESVHDVAERIITESQHVENELTARRIAAKIGTRQDARAEIQARLDAHSTQARQQPLRVRVETTLAENGFNSTSPTYKATVRRIVEQLLTVHHNDEAAYAIANGRIIALIIEERLRSVSAMTETMQQALQQAEDLVKHERQEHQDALQRIIERAFTVPDDGMFDALPHIVYDELAEYLALERGHATTEGGLSAVDENAAAEINRVACKLAEHVIAARINPEFKEVQQEIAYLYAMTNEEYKSKASEIYERSKRNLSAFVRSECANAAVQLTMHKRAARDIAETLLKMSEGEARAFTARERAGHMIVERIVKDSTIAPEEVSAHILAVCDREESEATFCIIVEEMVTEIVAAEEQRARAKIATETEIAGTRASNSHEESAHEIAKGLISRAMHPLPLLLLADLLDAQWHRLLPEIWPQWLQKQWPGTPVLEPVRYATYQVRGVNVSGEEIIQTLQPVIDKILNILTPVLAQNLRWSAAGIGSKLSSETATKSLADLYSLYVAFAEEQITQAAVPTRAELQEARKTHERIRREPEFLPDTGYNDSVDDGLIDDGLIDHGLPDDGLMDDSMMDFAINLEAPKPIQMGRDVRRFAWFIDHLEDLRRGNLRQDATLDTLAELVLFMGWLEEGPDVVDDR